MSIFVGAKAAVLSRVWNTEKNKYPQRQAPTIPRQTGTDAVAEPLAGKPYAATEEYQQADKVDRQAPSELNEVEKRPGPACGSDSFLRIMSGFIHMRNLFLFGTLYQRRFVNGEFHQAKILP